MEKVYEIDPLAIVRSEGEDIVISLPAPGLQQTLSVPPGIARTFLATFQTPATAKEASARYSQLALTWRSQSLSFCFEDLLGAAKTTGIVREVERDRSEDPPPAAAARVLTEISRTSEELISEILAMGTASSDFILSETGVSLHHQLRAVMIELIAIKVVLEGKRGAFLSDQVRRLRSNTSRLHLGAGRHLLENWTNIDLESPELRMNLLWSLPFSSSTVKYVFMSHLFEHFYKRTQALKILGEINRVLEAGGVLRLIVPNARAYMEAYVESDVAFFAMQRRVWPGWASKANSQLESIMSYLGASEAPVRGPVSHKYGYDFETLAKMLQEMGFVEIKESRYLGSSHEALLVDNCSAVAGANVNGKFASLFIEASKPK